jgi:acyl carrier protein
MNKELYDTISGILIAQFHVDPAVVRPDATLETLGLDSLTLMEFVFSVEDRFNLRIPEDKLDPRQAGFTLERVVQVLDGELLATSSPAAAASASSPS